MIRTCPSAGRVALFAVCIPSIGCTVVNPEYKGWSQFVPGASITFEERRTTNGEQEALRITDTLLAKDASRVVVERTLLTVDPDIEGEAGVLEETVEEVVELARIEPTAHLLTHPKRKTTRLPDETVNLGGTSIACKVLQVEVDADQPNWGQDVRATIYLSESVPGGIVRLEFCSETPDERLEMSGEIIEFDTGNSEE